MISDAQLLIHTRAESTETAYLRTLEQAAIQAVQNHTGRYYGAVAAITEYIEFRGWPIQLSNVPLSLTTFKLWDGSVFATVDATTYYLQGAFIYYNGTPSPWSSLTLPKRYQVVYQAGYTAVGDVWPAPADIQHAVLLLVGHFYENRESVVVGEGQYELPQSVTWLLDPHVKVAC